MFSGCERALTVSWKVVDQRGQEGDEDAGNDDVDDVEERLALDDQVEGDVLVLVALHGNVLVGVFLGWPMDDLPLSVLCGQQRRKTFKPTDSYVDVFSFYVVNLGSTQRLWFLETEHLRSCRTNWKAKGRICFN